MLIDALISTMKATRDLDLKIRLYALYLDRRFGYYGRKIDPSYPQIRADLGISRKTAQRWIDQAVRRGYLRRVRRANGMRQAVYEISFAFRELQPA